MTNALNNENLKAFMEVAHRAATLAGELISEKMGNVEIREKNPRDFVTQVDIEAQMLIQTVISDAFPSHQFLGEEETSDGADSSSVTRRGDNEFCWIVDPIDGTTNFIHQLPSFCVSIALRHRYDAVDEMIVGCILDPILKESYTAIKGAGAYLNGKSIVVSPQTSSRGALVVCSLPSQLQRDSIELQGLINVLCDSEATVRRLGSAALNLCYIAAGRLDAYWTASAKIWDIAAGVLILEEAGGAIEQLGGGAIAWQAPQVVAAATPMLVAEFQSLLSVK